ncbi:MAG: hypothetical protein HQK55_02190 [Deltaproteobacteria bacterium]|nr:hypothetical protein [Deltaproteobacteria bacterium]
MVLTITTDEYMRMKMALMDRDGEEAIKIIRELIKKLDQQAQQGLKSHLDK